MCSADSVFFCASVGEYKETNRAAVLQLLKDSAASLVFWLMRCSLCLQMRSMCGRQPPDTLLIVARLQALFSSLCWISDLHSFFFFAPSRNTPTTHLLFPPLYISASFSCLPYPLPSPHPLIVLHQLPSSYLTQLLISSEGFYSLGCVNQSLSASYKWAKNKAITWLRNWNSRFISFYSNDFFFVSGVLLVARMRPSWIWHTVSSIAQMKPDKKWSWEMIWQSAGRNRLPDNSR